MAAQVEQWPAGVELQGQGAQEDGLAAGGVCGWLPGLHMLGDLWGYGVGGGVAKQAQEGQADSEHRRHSWCLCNTAKVTQAGLNMPGI